MTTPTEMDTPGVLASNCTVGVDAQLFAGPRAGIARYTMGLMEATVAASPGVSFEAVVTKGVRSPRVPVDDVSRPGIRLVQPNFAVSKAIHYGRRAGLPTPMNAAVPKADAFLYPNYRWHPSRGRPSITFVYDLSLVAGPQWVDPAWVETLRSAIPTAVAKSTIIATISQSMAAEIAAHYPDAADRIHVFTPGPSPTFQIVDPETRLDALGVEAGYVLFVGTIEPRKNLMRLIEAANGRFRLVLAGRSGWSNGETITAADSSPWVTHISNPTDTDLAALYQGAAVVAQPSHYEGFGLPLLEAMSFGTPVACSDIAVFREVGANAVAYFDHNDPAAIAGTLTAVLSDGARRMRMAAMGRGRLEAFSWARTGTAFAKLLSSLTQ